MVAHLLNVISRGTRRGTTSSAAPAGPARGGDPGIVGSRVPGLGDTAVRPAGDRGTGRPAIVRFAAALACAALAATLLGPATAGAQPLRTGLSGVFDYTKTAYAQVKASGASTVRIGVPWGAIAPRQEPAQWNPEDPGDPHYEWGHVDEAVQHATEAGLEPLLIVTGAPRWAQGCTAPASYPESICEPDPAKLAQFAVAAARRFSGNFENRPRVRYWQGLNEPNLSLYLLPQFDTSGKLVSPQLYRKLINSFYAAVKSVDSSNLVLAAGLGPIAVSKYTIGPLEFARELLCLKGRQKPKPRPGDCEGGVDFDIFDIHPYTTGGPTHTGGPDDVELGNLGQLRQLLNVADRAGRIHGAFKRTPLWATEFSWDTKPPDPKGLPMKIAARWADEALHRAWSSGVDRLFWFGLRDEPINDSIPSYASAQSGLYFRGATVAKDKPKRIFYAFRFPFVAYPSSHKGMRIWGRTPDSRRGKVAIQVRRGGKWRTLKRVRANRQGMFRAVVRTRYGRNKNGAARARVSGVNSVPFSMRPVKDFYQPPFG